MWAAVIQVCFVSTSHNFWPILAANDNNYCKAQGTWFNQLQHRKWASFTKCIDYSKLQAKLRQSNHNDWALDNKRIRKYNIFHTKFTTIMLKLYLKFWMKTACWHIVVHWIFKNLECLEDLMDAHKELTFFTQTTTNGADVSFIRQEGESSWKYFLKIMTKALIRPGNYRW